MYVNVILLSILLGRRISKTNHYFNFTNSIHESYSRPVYYRISSSSTMDLDAAVNTTFSSSVNSSSDVNDEGSPKLGDLESGDRSSDVAPKGDDKSSKQNDSTTNGNGGNGKYARKKEIMAGDYSEQQETVIVFSSSWEKIRFLLIFI